jgi:3-hydroxyisobutyrate dehydrogenase-like beta-hydroxyacid dehydrogenase
MRVGFAGLGRMGAHMARNLVAAGHDVTVWNRSAAKAERLGGRNRVHGVAETPAHWPPPSMSS